MLPEWIATLAGTGASTLVTAAATDVWQTARAGFVRLFGRGDAARAQLAEARLDELAAARDDGEIGDQLVVWRTRLADLLQEDPNNAEALRALIDELTPRLPTNAGVMVQTNVAAGTARQFNVQSGILHVHGD